MEFIEVINCNNRLAYLCSGACLVLRGGMRGCPSASCVPLISLTGQSDCAAQRHAAARSTQQYFNVVQRCSRSNRLRLTLTCTTLDIDPHTLTTSHTGPRFVDVAARYPWHVPTRSRPLLYQLVNRSHHAALWKPACACAAWRSHPSWATPTVALWVEVATAVS